MNSESGLLKSAGKTLYGAILQDHQQRAASALGVEESDIQGVSWMDIGMTNKSFLLSVKSEKYVYRIPGQGTERYISRRQEADVYAAIKPLHVSDELVFLDPESGVKITKYYPNSHVVDDRCEPDLKVCMDILRKLHNSNISVGHSFDIEEKLPDFEMMCRERGCVLPDDLADVQALVQKPLELIRTSDLPCVLCHVDSANVNFLKCRDGCIRLLDFEYSGMCHAIADIAMFALFSRYSLDGYRQLLRWYLLREPTESEWRLCISYASAGGLLWFFWAVFRESFGENFLDYTHAMYQSAKDLSLFVQ